jgi:hypothetical protein
MSSVIDTGDVVVSPEVRQTHLVNVVRVDGSREQGVYETRAEATAEALEYARQAGVDAWYGDRAELGFVALCRCRTATGGQPARRAIERRGS